MARSKLNQLSDGLYKSSRAVGDLRALQQGRLLQRLVKRYIHRNEINEAKKIGLWP